MPQFECDKIKDVGFVDDKPREFTVQKPKDGEESKHVVSPKEIRKLFKVTPEKVKRTNKSECSEL